MEVKVLLAQENLPGMDRQQVNTQVGPDLSEAYSQEVRSQEIEIVEEYMQEEQTAQMLLLRRESHMKGRILRLLRALSHSSSKTPSSAYCTAIIPLSYG